MKSINQQVAEAMQSYLVMKTSLDQFGKIASELEPDENQQLLKVMEQTLRLYNAVLASNEAQQIVVAAAKVQDALQQLESRFAQAQDFNAVLKANNLNRKSLTSALDQEIRCEATLEHISRDCEALNEQQIQAYYFNNLKKFQQPERRRARHILITINDDFAENTEHNARKRLKKIAQLINGENFGWNAERHSECPTAVNGGILGLVKRDQLHQELDQRLFEMDAKAISEIIETDAGLHLLLCEEIQPAHTVSYQLAQHKIVAQHLNVARIRKQKAWIAGLLN